MVLAEMLARISAETGRSRTSSLGEEEQDRNRRSAEELMFSSIGPGILDFG